MAAEGWAAAWVGTVACGDGVVMGLVGVWGWAWDKSTGVDGIGAVERGAMEVGIGEGGEC